MKLLGVSTLVFLAFQEPVQAAISCTTTSDCAWGETCVAGDSDLSIQACVPATVCGGSSMGNCPSDADSGKLACLWRQYDDCSDGCAMMDGKKGIYKCVSLARCDAYYGGASCSDGCSVNGVRCNDQGSCNMMSTNADGTPSFGCTCDNGYSGAKCEVAPDSTASNSSTGSDDTDDEDSFWGNLDFSDDSESGSDDDDSNGSDDASVDTSDDSSTDASDEDSSADTSDDSSTDTSNDSSTDNADTSSENDEDANASSSSDASQSNLSPAAAADSVGSSIRSGIRPGVLILVLVMAAFFLIGTVLLVAYSRRRKQQEEEEYANALASTHGVGTVGAVDIASGHTGRTPRSNIATM